MGICCSTLVHVGKNGIMFQTLLKSFWLCSFWKRPDWSQKDLEPDLCFSTLVHVGKMGSGSKPFLNYFHPFHFERGQTVSKWDWNLASAFPLWSVLQKWCQVPNPFYKSCCFLFISKGSKLVPKGFGTWPLLLHFGSCWKKFWHFLKSFGWLSFWKGPSWSQRGLKPDLCFSTLVHVRKTGVKFQTLLKSFYSFSFWKGQTRPKWAWKLASAFPLWPMLEKMGSNSRRFLEIILVLVGKMGSGSKTF